MPHVIHALDRADAGDLRAATRPEHLAYVGGFGVLYGGPLLEDNGRMCGSLIVLDVDSREAAEEFAAGDPYAVAGLFERVTITGFRPVLGT
jgi:uncharacterized protein YciI